MKRTFQALAAVCFVFGLLQASAGAQVVLTGVQKAELANINNLAGLLEATLTAYQTALKSPTEPPLPQLPGSQRARARAFAQYAYDMIVPESARQNGQDNKSGFVPIETVLQEGAKMAEWGAYSAGRTTPDQINYATAALTSAHDELATYRAISGGAENQKSDQANAKDIQTLVSDTPFGIRAPGTNTIIEPRTVTEFNELAEATAAAFENRIRTQFASTSGNYTVNRERSANLLREITDQWKALPASSSTSSRIDPVSFIGTSAANASFRLRPNVVEDYNANKQDAFTEKADINRKGVTDKRPLGNAALKQGPK